MNISNNIIRDIVNSQKKKKVFARSLQAPLLILNGFKNLEINNSNETKPNENQLSLIYLMLQSMFPPLDLAKVIEIVLMGNN